MRRLISWNVAVCWLVLFAGLVGAATFQLVDGTTLEGDIILPGDARGLNLKKSDGQFERVPWTNFTQTALQEIARNPKLAEFVDPLIEIPEEAKVKKTEVEIKPYPKLERLPNGSLVGGLFNSSVGLVVLLLIYGANIYAAYEISIIRAYPAALVCGAAAVAPVIGPIVFLCVPTRLNARAEEKVDEAAAEGTHSATYAAGPSPAANEVLTDPLAPPTKAPGAAGLALSHAQEAPAAGAVPAPEVFQRGKYTFNRRFLETKFSGFFGVTRRGADKDMVLYLKTARGNHVASRITRITGNDMHVEVRKGEASQEVLVPFGEIQEIHLKHKDA